MTDLLDFVDAGFGTQARPVKNWMVDAVFYGLQVPPLLVYGPNGCGKTTFVRAVTEACAARGRDVLEECVSGAFCILDPMTEADLFGARLAQAFLGTATRAPSAVAPGIVVELRGQLFPRFHGVDWAKDAKRFLWYAEHKAVQRGRHAYACAMEPGCCYTCRATE